MLYEKARVLERYDSQLIWVETQIKTTCSSCQHNSECGTGLLARAMTRRKNQVLVVCEKEVVAGEEVTIAVSEDNLVSGAGYLYGVPLFLLMASLISGGQLFANELLLLAFSALVTGSGLLLVKAFLNRTSAKRALPSVVDKLPSVQIECPN
ncbi:SoxR reducing system RseC family protein [Gayadomonas joobiniege]|uniref:SoxR reducing system RseC family protein n=1 Tax=Gayadomonas joobiniege TaxID=1234606 RepID=UPI0003789958|nr:SoxR reducing system RseC family protein [Gayadomonas joobiniege]